MNSIKKLILFLMLVQVSIFASAINENAGDSLKLPEKALIISISSNTSGLYYTMIDLENNEMVIVYYGTDLDYTHIKRFGLRMVTRTGIILDPEDHKRMINTCRMEEKKE